jgi:hypothetical protein
MLIRERINLKKYFSLSFLLLSLSYFICNGPKEFLVVLIVFAGVVINQWLLVSSVNKLIKKTLNNESTSNFTIIASMFFKTIILVIAITFGVHFIGNRIIIPILIYIVQIFVLYLSLRSKQK